MTGNDSPTKKPLSTTYSREDRYIIDVESSLKKGDGLSSLLEVGPPSLSLSLHYYPLSIYIN